MTFSMSRRGFVRALSALASSLPFLNSGTAASLAARAESTVQRHQDSATFIDASYEAFLN